MQNDLRRFLEPRSIAVVGASPRPRSVGGTILRNLMSCGFEGEIYVAAHAVVWIEGPCGEE